MADETMESSGSPRPFGELRFVVVGAYVVDCFINTSRLPEWGRTYEARSIWTSPGGKALNQAVALARLGAQVAAVGVVGDDGVGRDVLAALEREQIDLSGMESRKDVATTVCACFVGDAGESAILWHIDEDVAVTPETVQAAGSVFEDADAVLVTFEMPLSAIRETINVARGYGARVLVQPAPVLANRADAKLVPWDQVNVLVPNEDEARALLDDRGELPVDELPQALARDLGVPTVVVTLGESGCVAHAVGSTRRYAAEHVVAADTTGAGDAFMAAFAVNLAAGVPDEQAIHLAQANAAQAVRRAGGYESMPSPL